MNALYKYVKNEMKINSFKTNKRSRKTRHTTIYIARIITLDKEIPEHQTCWLGNCMPCDNCQKNLHKYGINRIKYTDIIDGENVVCEMSVQ